MIKPCPFCGKEGQAVGSSSGWKVFCRKCYVIIGNNLGTYEEAVEAWNKRAGQEHYE